MHSSLEIHYVTASLPADAISVHVHTHIHAYIYTYIHTNNDVTRKSYEHKMHYKGIHM